MASLINKAMVISLYQALSNSESSRGLDIVLAPNLEWWFHGPPDCNHMMKLLTGEAPWGEFVFEPRNLAAIGDVVIAEGWEGAEAYWVHVWTVKDGKLVQFREYFNTWLTVKDLKPVSCLTAHDDSHVPTMWQSGPRDLASRSLPCLLLAI